MAQRLLCAVIIAVNKMHYTKRELNKQLSLNSINCYPLEFVPDDVVEPPVSDGPVPDDVESEFDEGVVAVIGGTVSIPLGSVLVTVSDADEVDDIS